MLLQNKNTGIRGELHFEPDKEYHFTVVTEDPSDVEIFRTLEALAEKWEDYKPAEPLIKDEKSRKLFREWAGFFSAEQFLVNHLWDSRRKTTSIGSTDIPTEPSIELPGHIGEDSQIYSITELCGEEEE